MTTDVLPGQILLHLAWLAAALAIVGAWRWYRGDERGRRIAAIGTFGSAASLLWAFGLLLAAFLQSDFRYAPVAGYSDRSLSLLYRFSAVWAGAEGSFLLWAMLGAMLAIALLRLAPSSDPLALAIFQASQIGLLVILVIRTPFARLVPAPADGQGLNPLLQDPWMATHPPIVFLGYAAAAVPFALALSAAWRGDRTSWIAPALRWTLVTVLTLGIGILLGAFWAYEVLGWGGYWGWDPVENSSLIPWILAVALLHGLVVQRQIGALARANLSMALATFALVLYATFLTRSGVLATVSVHSFPESGAFVPLLLLLLAALLAPMVALARRWRSLAGGPLSWTLDLGTVLSVGAALLALSAGVILLGTSWPLVTLAFGKTVALKPEFYNGTNLPIYVAITALLVAAPLLGWKAIPFRRLALVSIAPAATGIAAVAWALGAGISAPLHLALTFFSGAVVGSCLVRAARVVTVSPLQIGAPVAHVGMALLLLGVLVSSIREQRQEIRLPLGESATAFGQELRFEGKDVAVADRDRLRVVVDPAGAAVRADVELVPTKGGQTQHKPAIVRRWRGDLYLSPIGVERTDRLARQLSLRKGETAQVEGTSLTFERFRVGDHSDGMTVAAVLRLADGTPLEPSLQMSAGSQESHPVSVEATGLQVALVGMNVNSQQVVLELVPPGAPQALLLEASWKPGMNLVWGGALLLVAGSLVAWTRRRLRAREEAATEVPAAAPAVGRRGAVTRAARARRPAPVRG